MREARRERGMSQAQLAGEELTKGFISQVESGLVRPSVRSLQILAARLGKSLDYFLGDEPLATSKRLVFHRLAAEAAVERRDWAASRDEVTQALASKPEKRERATLLRFLAQAEMNTGNREVAFDRIGEALSLIDASTDAAEMAQLLHLRGIAYGQIGQYVAAAEALEAGARRDGASRGQRPASSGAHPRRARHGVSPPQSDHQGDADVRLCAGPRERHRRAAPRGAGLHGRRGVALRRRRARWGDRQLSPRARSLHARRGHDVPAPGPALALVDPLRDGQERRSA